jgi:hypothetical protein
MMPATPLATAADGHEDRAEVVDLLQQLQAQGALAADDRRVVVGRNERQTALLGQASGPELALDAVGTDRLDAPAESLDGRELRRIGVRGYDHGRRHTHDAAGVGDGGAVVAGRSGDDPTIEFLTAERTHLAHRASGLEGTSVLEVLAFEHDRGTECPGQAERRHRRRREQVRSGALLRETNLCGDLE